MSAITRYQAGFRRNLRILQTIDEPQIDGNCFTVPWKNAVRSSMGIALRFPHIEVPRVGAALRAGRQADRQPTGRAGGDYPGTVWRPIPQIKGTGESANRFAVEASIVQRRHGTDRSAVNLPVGRDGPGAGAGGDAGGCIAIKAPKTTAVAKGSPVAR